MHKDYIIIDLHEKPGYKIFKVKQETETRMDTEQKKKNNIGMQGFDVQGQI